MIIFLYLKIRVINCILEVSILTILFCVLLNSPRFIYYLKVSQQQTNTSYIHIAHLRRDLPNWNDTIYYWFYHTGLTFSIIFALPLCIIGVCNIYLIKALRHSKNFCSLHVGNGQRLFNKNSEYARIIVLNMVVVISKLLVFQTPDFLMSIIQVAKVDKNATAYKIFSTIKEMLLIINSSCNFIIYVTLNVYFRRALARKLCFYFRK